MNDMSNLLANNYVEYYVNDAHQVAYWHRTQFGFLENNRTQKAGVKSIYLSKNNIRLIITSTDEENEVQEFIEKHGEGIKRVGFIVNDLSILRSKMKLPGIEFIQGGIMPEINGNKESVRIRLFDDNEFVFTEKPTNHERFTKEISDDAGIRVIDHIAFALKEGELNRYEDFFNHVLETQTIFRIHKEDASKIGMEMRVLQNDNKLITNVLTEPVNKLDFKSQIQIFIDEHKGEGIQHLAFETEDIHLMVEELRDKGVVFTDIPDSYYDALQLKFPELPIQQLKSSGILCDVEGDALLLQIFTKPVGNRKTLFYEIIQRINDYNGFGINNIKTLFEAVQKNLESNKVS